MLSISQLEQELQDINKQRYDVEQRLRELAAREQRAQARKQAQQRIPLSYAAKRSRDGDPSVETAEPDVGSKRSRTVSSLIVDPHESTKSDEQPLQRRVASAIVASSSSTSEPAEEPQQQHEQHSNNNSTADSLNNKPRLPAVMQKPEEAKRSKRVFGRLLLGTLQRAQTELGSKSAAARRREAAEQRVEAKVVHDHDAYAEQQQIKLAEEKEKELARRAEIEERRDAKELQLLELKWKLHDDLLSHWFKTEVQPSIFYRPKGILKPDRVTIERPSQGTTDDKQQAAENAEMREAGEEPVSVNGAVAMSVDSDAPQERPEQEQEQHTSGTAAANNSEPAAAAVEDTAEPSGGSAS